MFFKHLPIDVKKEINYFTDANGLETMINAGPIRLESYSFLALKELFSRRDDEALKVQQRFLMQWLHFGRCPYPSILWPQTAEEKTLFEFGTLPFEDLFLRLKLRAMLMNPEGYQNFEANPPALILVRNDKSHQRILPVLTNKEAKYFRPADKEGRLNSKQIRKCLADIKRNLNPVDAIVFFDDIAPYLEADHLLALFQNNPVFRVRFESDVLKKNELRIISPEVMRGVFYGYKALYDKIQTPKISDKKELIVYFLGISPFLPEKELLLCLTLIRDIFNDTELFVNENLLIHAIKGAKCYPAAIRLLKNMLFDFLRLETLSMQLFLAHPFFIILLRELAETFATEELRAIKTRLFNFFKVEKNDVLLVQSLAIFAKLDKENSRFASVWNVEDKQFMMDFLDATKEKHRLWVFWQYCCSLSSLFSEDKAREYWVLFKPHLAEFGFFHIDEEELIGTILYPGGTDFPLFLKFLPRADRGAELLEVLQCLPSEDLLFFTDVIDDIFQFETPRDPHFDEAYACYEEAIKTRSSPQLFFSEQMKAFSIEKILRANFCKFIINNNGVLGGWDKANDFLDKLIKVMPTLDNHTGLVVQAISLLLKQIPVSEYFVYYCRYMAHVNNNNYLVSDSVFLALPSLLSIFWMPQNSEQKLDDKEMKKLILHTLTMEAKTPEFVALQRMAHLWTIGFGPEFSKWLDAALEENLAADQDTASSSMQP